MLKQYIFPRICTVIICTADIMILLINFRYLFLTIPSQVFTFLNSFPYLAVSHILFDCSALNFLRGFLCRLSSLPENLFILCGLSVITNL